MKVEEEEEEEEEGEYEERLRACLEMLWGNYRDRHKRT